jgi:hypothetical protein
MVDRLPQLDLVPFRIQDVHELAVVESLDLVDDRGPGRAQLLDQRLDVLDPVIDHELLRRWREIRASALERTPLQVIDLFRTIRIPELESRAPWIRGQAEILGIPGFGSIGIVGKEEDAADTGDFGWEGHGGSGLRRVLPNIGKVASSIHSLEDGGIFYLSQFTGNQSITVPSHSGAFGQQIYSKPSSPLNTL